MTPRSVSERTRRPRACCKETAAAGSQTSANREAPAASTRRPRSASRGSSGRGKGSRSSTRSDRLSPGTSNPSKKVRVATSTLATSSRKRAARRAGTSSPWTSSSYGRWARAAANDSTARQEVHSTRARPWEVPIRETSSRSAAAWNPSEEGWGTAFGTYSRALARKSKGEAATTVAGSATPRARAATPRLPATARVAEQATVAGTRLHSTPSSTGPGSAAPLLDPHRQVGRGRRPAVALGRGGEAAQVAGQGAEAAAGGQEGRGLVVGVTEVLEGRLHGLEVGGQRGEGGDQGGVGPATGDHRAGVEVGGQLLVAAPEAAGPVAAHAGRLGGGVGGRPGPAEAAGMRSDWSRRL